MNQQNPFKWRHFEAEIMPLCVRWYLRYSLSYRDLEENDGCSNGIWWINRSALSKPPSGWFSSVVSPNRLPHLGVRLLARAAASTFTHLPTT